MKAFKKREEEFMKPMIPNTEVMRSRGLRALEGEGRGLSHLEVIVRGRLWRQLASRDRSRRAARSAQRVSINRLFLSHLSALPVTVNLAATNNPIDWWISQVSTVPTLHRDALDTLSCPAMSAECERAFS